MPRVPFSRRALSPITWWWKRFEGHPVHALMVLVLLMFGSGWVLRYVRPEEALIVGLFELPGFVLRVVQMGVKLEDAGMALIDQARRKDGVDRLRRSHVIT